jgi:8-oxo-dGTP pyrophosphatase MutT (NUDIX family)
MANFIDKVAWIYINDDNKALVGREEGKDVFYIPGGRRDGNESDAQVLKRELKEELDIDFDTESMEFVGEYSAEAHDKPGVIVVTKCYLGNFSGEIKPSSEIVELMWVSEDEVGSEKISPVSQKILTDVKKKGLFNK